MSQRRLGFPSPEPNLNFTALCTVLHAPTGAPGPHILECVAPGLAGEEGAADKVDQLDPAQADALRRAKGKAPKQDSDPGAQESEDDEEVSWLIPPGSLSPS